jgi:GTP 3',8-cyclase
MRAIRKFIFMNSTYLSQVKIFNHLDRVQAWLKNGICFPISMQIDPTNSCTRNCLRCAGNKTVKNARLSLEFMEDVINQISSFCKGLIFTGGGEPLCNSDTMTAIKYARSKGIDVGLVTNSDLIDLNTAKQIIANCSYVRISYLDDNVWNKIKMLVRAKKDQKSDCIIGVGFLTNKEKAGQMHDIIKAAKKAKVDYIEFRPYHLDTFNASKKIEKFKIKFNSNNFQVIANDYKYKEMKESNKKTKKYPVCFGDNFRAVIAADGKVYPDCFTRGFKNFCLGNLRKESFKKIWASARRRKIFNSKLNISNCPPICYYDPLDELLWNIWRQYQEGRHVNFI